MFNEGKGIASITRLSAMLIGECSRQQFGHKCVSIPRIRKTYVLVVYLLFSLAHVNTGVYVVTSEAPHENGYR